MLVLDASDRAAIRSVIGRLESSWNQGSASGFVQDFAVDADFVNIYGGHGSGRDVIRQALDRMFVSTYAGSRSRFSLETVRLLSPDVALAHVRAHLRIPGGPEAGETRALPSLVLQRENGGWKIASYHNTLIENPDRPGGRR
jgi:uncharacterized protein (TIGR02246 family)